MTDEKKGVTLQEMNEQELALNIQVLQEQGRILASNVERLSIYLQELATSRATLEGMQSLKKGDEILVPIGASSFIRARIDDTEKVIVGVGSNVSVDKTLDDAATSMQERIDLVESRIRESQDAYVKVAQKLDVLTAEAQKRVQSISQ
ncbi:MAG: prefoldin subunit alpha [Theionarchaea archaeon]|nr:prefoldin subunit alpha [Theionarchaea archaeon]MBU7000757.1 prefoldin subunit alpha [Theionarchaea archaeon]MBU7021460.1 prefoldin subunit alpha [Theionarchaea archaeon]MBU7033599.1 prefoldin subunit alpha [Theionarchaea archaeon]MBU7040720.1 prefoldin subunit alpha [Theionarchaea archaeon]